MTNETASKTEHSYYQRILKYIPTEFVGAYLVFSQVASNLDVISEAQPILIILVITLLCILVFVSNKLMKKGWLETIVIAVSFVVWTYTMGDAYRAGDWIRIDIYNPLWAGALLIIWTILAPVLMQLQNRTE